MDESEKYPVKTDTAVNASSPPPYGETRAHKANLATRMIDSFRRDPNRTITRAGVVGANGKVCRVLAFSPTGG